MFYIEYVETDRSWSLNESSDSIISMIKTAKQSISRYSEDTIAVICQEVDGGHYQIGYVTYQQRWVRETYKLYNALEDSSSAPLYKSKFPERISLDS